jgi:hypothetical protein
MAGAGVGFALWQGTLAAIVCSALLVFGLLFALIPGHGLIHIMRLWQGRTDRGRKKDE